MLSNEEKTKRNAIGYSGETIGWNIIQQKIRPEYHTIQDTLLFDQAYGWYTVEIKYKEAFQAGDNYGHNSCGSDLKQLKTRIKLYEDKGIKTLILYIEIDKDNIPTGSVYQQWLHILESKDYHDLAKIRLYPLKNFKKKVFPKTDTIFKIP
jgi:hypothetical protein